MLLRFVKVHKKGIAQMKNQNCDLILAVNKLREMFSIFLFVFAFIGAMYEALFKR